MDFLIFLHWGNVPRPIGTSARTTHRPNDFELDDHGNKIPDPSLPNKLKEKVNGRGAHVNHFHFQLGPTNYKDQNGNSLPRTR